MNQIDTVQHLGASWAGESLGNAEELLILLLVSIYRMKLGIQR